MRIAVLADTHDRFPPHVAEAIVDADEIWHLGDVTAYALLESIRAIGPPLRNVRGNCDSCEDWPDRLDFTIEGYRIRLIHIPPKSASGIDLLLHGHTHVPRDEVIGRTRFLNPGCVTRPNRGAPASYAWLELISGKPITWQLRLL